jgi:hypothetical protein
MLVENTFSPKTVYSVYTTRLHKMPQSAVLPIIALVDSKQDQKGIQMEIRSP